MGLLLAPAEGFGLRPRVFLPFGQKKNLIMLFWPIFGNFSCPVVTLVTFSSNLTQLSTEACPSTWLPKTLMAHQLNPSQEGYYNSINPLVKGVPPHIPRPSSARWRPVNMWGNPFYYGNNHIVSWVPPHIHRPQIFRCLRPGPPLFPCSSMHWTTVLCIAPTLTQHKRTLARLARLARLGNLLYLQPQSTKRK